MNDQSTRVGKIARLPAKIREEVNMRLHDGQTASKIIAWLHSVPEVLTILDEQFKEDPVSAQNISEWRAGGYKDWLARRDRVDNLKLLSSYAFDLAKAGGSVSDGAAAIAGGRLLEMLETADEKTVGGLASALATLRSSEASSLNAQTNRARLEQREREIGLEEQKFQRQTAALFVKWARTPEAQAILGSREAEAVQMEKLVQLMFGERPQ